MNRRSFFLTPATAGASGAWAGANDRLRIAVIGLGGKGGSHMQKFAAIEGVEVPVICDPDETRMARHAGELEAKTGRKPRMEPDLRRIMDDKTIDAIAIATTNHWHAPCAIYACQAGKHVYVEKPVSHNMFEGRKLVEASRKYGRIVQGGTQSRSRGRIRKAVGLIRQGVIGDVFMARAIVYGNRQSIGFKDVEQPPPHLHWDLWLGPAQQQPFHRNLVHYNWHWFWDFGNGELGNNGSHVIDIARWAFGRGLPSRIVSTGARLGYKDQAQTPNMQIATYEYDDGARLTCETRGLYSNEEQGIRWGAFLYGTNGYMVIPMNGDYKVYLGRNRQQNGGIPPEPDMGSLENIDHNRNFIDAIRAGKRELLTAEVEESHLSCALCHLGNIAFRMKRALRFDPRTEKFIGDEEANRLLTREYRKPFLVPEKI